MAAAIGLRGDFTSLRLRELAKGSRCPELNPAEYIWNYYSQPPIGHNQHRIRK